MDTSERRTGTYQVTSSFMPVAASPPSSSPSKPMATKSRRRLLLVLIVLVILALVGAGLGTFYFLTRSGSTTATPPVVGHAFFVSSGQVNDSSPGGINDELEIDLHNIPAPAPGKSYYAWLLSDASQVELAPVLLGTLRVNHGNVHHLYPDAQHINLLETTSRFLVTEQDGSVTPTNPSPDHTTWRYMATLAQTADPTDKQHHFSLLDHLRFLLSQDPQLTQVGLAGGLDIWLFRNTGKILEWAGSARDDWKSKGTGDMRAQLTRILDYLDGVSSVQADVPGTGVIVDRRPASIGLLGFNNSSSADQLSPGYLQQIGGHLIAITQAPGVTAGQRTLTNQIYTAINNVTHWLETVHDNARQLIQMSDKQLLQPSTLLMLDQMQAQAFYAYTGKLDPSTNTIQAGVVQIHFDIQGLATFDITPYTASS